MVAIAHSLPHLTFLPPGVPGDLRPPIHMLSLIKLKLTIPNLPTKSKVDRSFYSHVTVNQKRLTFLSIHPSIHPPSQPASQTSIHMQPIS